MNLVIEIEFAVDENKQKCNLNRYFLYTNVHGILEGNADSTDKFRVPSTICGCSLQVADSAYSCGFRVQLWIPQLYADSVQLWIPYSCGFRVQLWIPYSCSCRFRVQLRIPQICLFWRNFELFSVTGFCWWNP